MARRHDLRAFFVVVVRRYFEQLEKQEEDAKRSVTVQMPKQGQLSSHIDSVPPALQPQQAIELIRRQIERLDSIANLHHTDAKVYAWQSTTESILDDVFGRPNGKSHPNTQRFISCRPSFWHTGMTDADVQGGFVKGQKQRRELLESYLERLKMLGSSSGQGNPTALQIPTFPSTPAASPRVKQTVKKLKVFVNYRRADDKIFVELLRTHFMYRYGQENVFMDFDSLPPFTNFEKFIRETVRNSDVVAMMIGKRWAELMSAKAAQGGHDYVLIELEEALKHNKVIAPICILGAKMPPMPRSIKPIARIHAQFVSDGIHLLDDVNRIMKGFEAELKQRGEPRSVSNPTSPQQMLAAQTHGSGADLDEMLDRYTDAVKADDLPQALIRVAELRASGQEIPDGFELDRREMELQVRLREGGDRRRRREAADFQYKFVRRMIKLGDPAEKIQVAVNAIWQIDQGYVPDDLAPEIGRLMGRGTLSAPNPFIAVTSLILPLLEWINVPVGSVTLEEGWDGRGWNLAKNYSQVPLATYPVAPFAMSKYPVTNAQYQAFVADGGYGEDRWWQGLAQRFTEPGKTIWTIENHPREMVSWYETVAFCRWLSAKTGLQVSLTTEQQWQYAAQGSDGWAFPWGSTFDKTLCNTQESGIGKTTPVDRYPNGKSPFGPFDMVGNVWEWCLNDYADPSHVDASGEAPRVVRGGSWLVSRHFARAASRGRNTPDTRSHGIGFRVVRVVPSP